MNKIVLSGAGQLGSRHLQGLAKTSIPLDIYVVDPSQSSLDTARERYSEVAKEDRSKQVKFCTSLSQAAITGADLAIVATNADVRPAVVEQLLSAMDIKNLILEKVVFQTVELFDNALETFKRHNVNVWVNCSRRAWPFYKNLRTELQREKEFRIEVSGSDWGMACNAIHFVDLFAFLTGVDDIKASGTSFDPVLKESKRKGFFEVTGSVTLENVKGEMVLRSAEEPGIERTVTIRVPGKKYIINEQQGTCSLSFNTTTAVQETGFNFPFQSGLTGEIAEDILLNGKCNLTGIGESYLHHKAILPLMMEHFYGLTGKKICPIT